MHTEARVLHADQPPVLGAAVAGDQRIPVSPASTLQHHMLFRRLRGHHAFDASVHMLARSRLLTISIPSFVRHIWV